MLLALDLGRHTGWAAEVDGTVLHGMIDFGAQKSGGRFEGGGMCFLRMRRWLAELHDTSKIEEVVFEMVHRHLGTAAGHAYGGYLATLTAWCEERGVPYTGVPVQAIKKFATGRGNAKKELVIEASKRWVVGGVKDDNEADALALLYYYMHQMLT